MEFSWLPERDDWTSALAETGSLDPETAWDALRSLADFRLDATKTNQLYRALSARFTDQPPQTLSTKPLRLALLSSSTADHLIAAIHVGALRHGIWLQSYVSPYGAYFQDLIDPASGLGKFKPDVVVFAFDAPHAADGIDRSGATISAVCQPFLNHLEECWQRTANRFQCSIIQQTILPSLLPVLGSNEHRLHNSRVHAIDYLNGKLRRAAQNSRVDLLSIDTCAARFGLNAWHDPVWWLRAKYDVKPSAAPFYGELVARILAARQGLSKKCLVLDLDNTLWGGVVGDDGVVNLTLGQGSAEGEAYRSFQLYLRELRSRGVLLAIVSKNDEKNAIEAIDTHPEMILRRTDFVAVTANWDDKALNIRRLASTLNLGVDAFVFVDDNPFERELVRRELPMVAVPEIGHDPAYYAPTLADAGYFEAVAITDDDLSRHNQYAANAARHSAQQQSSDMALYLRSLEMVLRWKSFDKVDLTRIVQLINKTNQFNLTTRRVSEKEIVDLMSDETSLCLQFRLNDRFGDNGLIGIIIARHNTTANYVIDTWLMSCRVLGRHVEDAMLNILAAEANRQSAKILTGSYRPTGKNKIVETLYPRLGFSGLATDSGEEHWYQLRLETFRPPLVAISTEQAD